MTKYTRIFITLLLAVIAFGAKSQSTATSSSPYSRYGLGDIIPQLLPQNIGMGGISTAINRISGYNNINPSNPASYGSINFTTIDAGIYSNILSVSQIGQTGSTNGNFRLSHIAFAIPTSRHSAISFGLLPYSEVGYNNKQVVKSFGTGSPVDTNAVNYIYSGNGGLSKAYFGYGVTVFKHLLLGANASYIFGNLEQIEDTQIPTLYGTLNSKVDQSSAIKGINYDFGAQYSFDIADTKHLILGYSASTGNNISSTSSYVISQYTFDLNGVENIAADTVVNTKGAKTNIKLPQINHFGISYQSDGHFIIGADYSTGKWSALTNAGVPYPDMQDSKTINVGGQFTPDINSLRNYFARTDYRLGFIYNQTYLDVNGVSIKSHAVTFGFGLPLAPANANLTFYKINFSAEIGQRGTLNNPQNPLVKENYVNLHLSFTLNDKWFQKFKFE